MADPSPEDTTPDTPLENEKEPLASEKILETESGKEDSHSLHKSHSTDSAGSSVVRRGQNVLSGAKSMAGSAAQAANKATANLAKGTIGVAKNVAKVATKPLAKKASPDPTPAPTPEATPAAPVTPPCEIQPEEIATDVHVSGITITHLADPSTSVKEKDPAPPIADPVSSTKSSTTPGLLMDDHMILWVVVASVGVLQLLENLSKIAANQVPLSVVLASMLLAFTVGLEMDGNSFRREIKARILGLEDDTVLSTTSKKIEPIAPIQAEEPEEEILPRNPISRFLRRRQRGQKRSIPPMTALRRRAGTQAHQNKRQFNANLLKRLQRFRTRRSTDDILGEEEPLLSGQIDSDEHTKPTSHTMGSADINKAHADVLHKKLDVEPMFILRGLDIFLADISESEMSNHPFLLKNGLREFPTFVFNLMTQWGNLLVYLEMPKWVQDFGDSIVENEDDPDNVKALKRFLNGTDEYRQARLKLMPEFIEAAYAIRLMAPKGREITLNIPDFVGTTYRVHDVAGKHCPIMEVTLDLMGNSTVRGMASLVKRYLKGLSVDLALVISTPDGQEEKDPEACLGLFRFDHLDVTKYPNLPDRFETDGCSPETVDSIRASMLVKTAQMQSFRAAAAAAAVS